MLNVMCNNLDFWLMIGGYISPESDCHHKMSPRTLCEKSTFSMVPVAPLLLFISVPSHLQVIIVLP